MHREFLRTAPLVLMLLGATVVAPAQQPSPPADAQQQSQQEKAQQTQSGKTGTVEPSALAPTDKPPANAVFFNGALAVPDAPANSQTVPAKFSTRNAALDLLPIMGQPLPLTDAQKQRIAESIAKANPPVAQINAKPLDFLPTDTKLYDMPADVAADIPWVRDLKYVRMAGKIALVRAPNMVMVGEIPTK